MPSTLPKLSRFQVLGRLATGRIADVWLARVVGVGFESLVVIKTIHPHLAADPIFVSRFIDEGRLAARLNHPNCVQVYELAIENGWLFCSMEYVEGFSLARVLDRAREKNLPPPEEILARIAMDAASGLEHAHTAQLVHGDVSADDVLVSFEGQTRLGNFGTARAMTHLEGEQDARADLFALGVVVSRALLHKQAAALSRAVTLESRFDSARAMRQAIEVAVGAAEPRGVAEYLSRLWPAGDPDRLSLEDLSQGRREEERRSAHTRIFNE